MNFKVKASYGADSMKNADLTALSFPRFIDGLRLPRREAAKRRKMDEMVVIVVAKEKKS